MILLLIAFILFVLVIKAWALWIAARNGSKLWFVLLFILQTLGILEIVYIFFITKEKQKTPAPVSTQ